jgi:hypothetical protein
MLEYSWVEHVPRNNDASKHRRNEYEQSSDVFLNKGFYYCVQMSLFNHYQSGSFNFDLTFFQYTSLEIS